MKKAVSYIRVSSKGQEDQFSLNSQRKLLNEYAKKKNLKIVQEFEEVESAKDTGREKFNKMIDLLKKDKSIEYILIEKTDRMTRNHLDNHTLYQLTLPLHRQ